MKPFITLAFLCLTVLYGCKKSETKPNATIIGKWFLTKTILSQTTNGLAQANETTIVPDKTAYTIFNSDGTGTSVNSNNSSSFSYVLTGSSITFTPNNDNGIFNIQSLSSSSFVLHEAFSYTTGLNTTTGIIDSYFIK